MSALLALVAVALPAFAGAQGDAAERALQLTAAGEYARAFAVAEEISDTSSRAESRVWVLYSAGLLDEALVCAERALEQQEDAWLRARAVQLAVTLHDAPTAMRHLAALEQVPEVDAAELTALRAEALALAESEDSRERALLAARVTTLSVLGACAAALLVLAKSR